MANDVDPQRTRRLLRLRIGRLRRRLDGRAHALKREGRRLASWRTYVTLYPAYAVLVALGLGMTASGGWLRGGWTRLFGLKLIRRAAGKTVDSVFDELKAIWADATPDERAGDSDGAGHGRS